MIISNELSKKIKVISFVGIVFVVFIHTEILNLEKNSLFNSFQSFLRVFFDSFHPLFFSISGFLFFNNFNLSKDFFFKKYKSRFKSLLIPYLLWNIIFLSIMLVLKKIPATSIFINSDWSGFFSQGVFKILFDVFISPIAFHLWFLRDLIIIVFFSPLIYYLVKKNIFLPLIFIFFLQFTSNEFVYFSSFFPFTIGVIFAIKYPDLLNYKVNNFTLLFLFFATITICFINVRGIILKTYLAWFSFLFLWFLYDFLKSIPIKSLFFEKILPYTFFIYVFHEPLLNVFKKLILKFGNNSNISLWLSYFFSPVFTILFSIITAIILKKYFLKIYIVITGGRN